MTYYIYFAKSLKTNKVYVGSTSKEPEDRVKEHNNGSNKWSKLNKPLNLYILKSISVNKTLKDERGFTKPVLEKQLKN